MGQYYSYRLIDLFTDQTLVKGDDLLDLWSLAEKLGDQYVVVSSQTDNVKLFYYPESIVYSNDYALVA